MIVQEYTASTTVPLAVLLVYGVLYTSSARQPIRMYEVLYYLYLAARCARTSYAPPPSRTQPRTALVRPAVVVRGSGSTGTGRTSNKKENKWSSYSSFSLAGVVTAPRYHLACLARAPWLVLLLLVGRAAGGVARSALPPASAALLRGGRDGARRRRGAAAAGPPPR